MMSVASTKSVTDTAHICRLTTSGCLTNRGVHAQHCQMPDGISYLFTIWAEAAT